MLHSYKQTVLPSEETFCYGKYENSLGIGFLSFCQHKFEAYCAVKPYRFVPTSENIAYTASNDIFNQDKQPWSFRCNLTIDSKPEVVRIDS